MWSPLAGGLLSGKYRRGEAAPAGARHASSSQWKEPPVHDEGRMYDIVEALTEVATAHGRSADLDEERAEVVEVATAHGRSPAQAALAYLLATPAVSPVVVGARTEAQLADNLGAVDWTLASDERARLDAVSAPRMVYPYWHQANTASDRLSPGDETLLRRRG